MTRNGFTLIELIVTIIIAILVFTGIVAGYSNFTNRAKIQQVASSMTNDLRMAQNKALSGFKPINDTCTQLDGYLVTITRGSITVPGSYTYQAQCNGVPAGDVYTVTLPTGYYFGSATTPATFMFLVLTKGLSISSTAVMRVRTGALKYEVRLTPEGDFIDKGFVQ